MAKRNRFINYFSLGELILLLGSWGVIVATFYLFRSGDYLSLFASLVGVTALVFNAKGHPIGQALIILFSLLYGFISYTCRYYGEMITYLAMTAPMAVAALVSWLKNQSEGKKGEVKINSIAVKEYLFAACLSLAVSVAFYFFVALFEYGEFVVEHDFRVYKFLRGVSYLSSRAVVCPCLRGERSCAYRFVDKSHVDG